MDTENGTPKEALAYPFGGTVPQRGELLEIAPGVRWLAMPLPVALARINLWALSDGDGWTLVDTGVRNDDTTAAWEALLTGPLTGSALKRVIVTHMHPDHAGMAGDLTRRFGCRLWMTQLEYLHCRMLVGDTGRTAPDEPIAFYRRAGWDETAIEAYRTRFGAFGRLTSQLPDSFRRLRDGEVIRIGKHDWEVIVGTGHTPEHACLYCAELKLFISGDQVLPRISSNVSVHPTEPDADPIGGWLDSIEMLRRRVPGDVLVLPAHNEPFTGLHERLDQLAASQARALGRLRETLRTPHRVIDVFGTLFSRPVLMTNPSLLGLATGESIAHLNYLIHRGQARVEIDDTGLAWYTAC